MILQRFDACCDTKPKSVLFLKDLSFTRLLTRPLTRPKMELFESVYRWKQYYLFRNVSVQWFYSGLGWMLWHKIQIRTVSERFTFYSTSYSTYSTLLDLLLDLKWSYLCLCIDGNNVIFLEMYHSSDFTAIWTACCDTKPKSVSFLKGLSFTRPLTRLTRLTRPEMLQNARIREFC